MKRGISRWSAREKTVIVTGIFSLRQCRRLGLGAIAYAEFIQLIGTRPEKANLINDSRWLSLRSACRGQRWEDVAQAILDAPVATGVSGKHFARLPTVVGSNRVTPTTPDLVADLPYRLDHADATKFLPRRTHRLNDPGDDTALQDQNISQRLRSRQLCPLPQALLCARHRTAHTAMIRICANEERCAGPSAPEIASISIISPYLPMGD